MCWGCGGRLRFVLWGWGIWSRGCLGRGGVECYVRYIHETRTTHTPSHHPTLAHMHLHPTAPTTPQYSPHPRTCKKLSASSHFPQMARALSRVLHETTSTSTRAFCIRRFRPSTPIRSCDGLWRGGVFVKKGCGNVGVGAGCVWWSVGEWCRGQGSLCVPYAHTHPSNTPPPLKNTTLPHTNPPPPLLSPFKSIQTPRTL